VRPVIARIQISGVFAAKNTPAILINNRLTAETSKIFARVPLSALHRYWLRNRCSTPDLLDSYLKPK
jgi:hypothetical protein